VKVLSRPVLGRLVPGLASALAVAAFAAPTANAATISHHRISHHDIRGARGTVFVQTDNTAGNAVAVYDRASGGTLTLAGTYATGGLGGQLGGSVVDHLASQGSLQYDREHGLLYAVNAGSDTVSVFGVYGDQLTLRQVVSSGGTFPVSVTVHGDYVYVLNALGGGSVYGYRVDGGQLSPIPGSGRALGLNPAASPQYLNSPGQVAFTPDGSALLVTTKANTNDVDVFSVGRDGQLSASPVVNSEPGAVPFAISFDPSGDVLIAEAGPSALATFALSRGGTLTQLDSALTGQTATCWVTRAGRYFFTSNAGSASVSGYQVGPDGSLTALGNTATDTGTVDAVAAAHGRFLYVQTGGAGIVDEYAVGQSGSLTEIGSVTVAGAVGGEGIAAS
jgi:6-phosphogluconolactonase (cycloisomerase 2 family)